MAHYSDQSMRHATCLVSCYQHLIPVLCKLHTNIYNPGLYDPKLGSFRWSFIVPPESFEANEPTPRDLTYRDG